MMPSCSNTGTRPHFTVSTTSGSAAWMIARMRASVWPRQSSNEAIFASIRWEAVMPSSLGSGVIFPMGFHRSHTFAGQPAGLSDPVGELGLVDRFVLVDVEIAHVLLI